MTLTLPWRGSRKAAANQVDNLRTTLDRTTDQAARVAEQAAHYARKGADELRRQAPAISRQAAEVSQHAAEVARAGAERVRAAADDVAALQIVRRRDVTWRPRLTLVAGLATGIAAMFFLDPEQGRRRRTMARDRLAAWSKGLARSTGGRARDLRNRTVGAAIETRKAITSAAENMAGDGVGFGGPLSAEPGELAERDGAEPVRSGAGR